MTNRTTHDAGHSETPIGELQKWFGASRVKTGVQFERLDESKAAFHERLQTPMRIVDIACMTGEHDAP